MLDKVTVKTISQLLDGFDINHEIEDDSQIKFSLDATEEFPYELTIRIMVDEEWVKIYAVPDDFTISINDSTDYLLAVNHYNSWKVRIKGALIIIKEIKMITLKAENVYNFTGPISVEHLWQDCILFSLAGIRDFYNSIEKCKKEVLEDK